MSERAAIAGRIVSYKLTQNDADAINNRANSNHAVAGELHPALIVREWSPECVNLQVFYDGEGSLWATSRSYGDTLGRWHWRDALAGDAN